MGYKWLHIEFMDGKTVLIEIDHNQETAVVEGCLQIRRLSSRAGTGLKDVRIQHVYPVANIRQYWYSNSQEY